MIRRKKKKAVATRTRRASYWSSLSPERRIQVRRGVGGLLAAATLMVGGSVAVARLDAHVKRELLAVRPFGHAEFVDLPESMILLAQGDLEDSIASLLDGPWTEDWLCRAMAQRLQTVGWVDQVEYVRRGSDGRFSVSCRYRVPTAMVARGESTYLVDGAGVRLPGVYRFDPAWPVIEGAGAAPPEAGVRWAGDDVAAGLKLLAFMRAEPFSAQISGVSVENYRGRVNPRSGHLSLLTSRAGGRIGWGSAAGQELEENSAAQKLAILRENYRKTGRVDGGHLVIDVSTFPDRYTIPG